MGHSLGVSTGDLDRGSDAITLLVGVLPTVNDSADYLMSDQEGGSRHLLASG